MLHRKTLLTLALLFTLSLLLTSAVSAQTTAQTDFEAVLSAAQGEANDASFLGLVGDGISYLDGTAESWFYLMQSEEENRLFGYVRSSEGLSNSLNLSEFPSEIRDMFQPGPINARWLDSDIAVSIAEDNGGAAFRSEYENTRISAALIGIPSTELLDLELPPIPALWLISYSSLSESSFASSIHIVDAIFGLHIQIDPSTAESNLEAANESAQAFAVDAQLISVSSLLPDFSPEGKASVWQFTYYSPSLDEAQVVYLAGGLALASTPTLVTPLSNTPLPEEWLGSTYAAERASVNELIGTIIKSPSLVQARLSRGLSEENEDTALWQINYFLFGDNFLEDLVDNLSLEGISVESILVEAEAITPVVLESQFTLVDADTDQPVNNFDPILQDALLDLTKLPTSLNISVRFDDDVDQVLFELNGDIVRTESLPPYALFGDNQGDFNAGDLPVQKHTLRAIPVKEGISGAPVVVTFEVVNSSLPSISGLFIIDADTDEEVFELADGAVFQAGDLPERINLKAVSDNQVQSVLFEINGGVYKRLENVTPFALFGDINGNFLGSAFPAGGYTLDVSPFADVMMGGQAGPVTSIRFTVLNNAPGKNGIPRGYFIEPIRGGSQEAPDTFALNNNYPNPFNPVTTITFNVPTTSHIQIRVYDILGRYIATLADATFETGSHSVQFNAVDLTSGTYFYRLITPEGAITKKMLLLQ